VLAAVLHGPEDLRVEDIAEPAVGAGQAKVQVAACGICGSDLHLFRGAGWKGDSPRPPFVIGHEFAGTVVETGRGAGNISVGDAVSVRPLVACGECPACANGFANVCVRLRFYGVSPDLAGGMAQFAVVDAGNLHRLPAGLSPAKAALAEPIAVGMHAARRGLEQGGETAVVLGGGPIGIAIFLALSALGLRDVYIVEPSDTRRDAICALGADVVIDPSNTNVVEKIRTLTGGVGADITFDAAGVPQTFTDAQRMAARRGRIVIVAGYEKPVTFDPFLTLSTEQLITAALAYTREDFEMAIATVADLGDVSGWVTTLDIRDVSSGFRRLSEQRGVKLLVSP
jgi:(R,R)-butanediol dehydrogenase / meso-butanediol dehydrogenase / diacetyl reductase